MAKIRALTSLIAALTGVAAATPVATQGQTRVTNTATLHWQAPTGPVSIDSNTVVFDVEARGKRPTRLSFRLLPIGYSLQGMQCQTAPSQFRSDLQRDQVIFEANGFDRRSSHRHAECGYGQPGLH